MHAFAKKEDYADALSLIDCCISSLKNGGKTEDMLYVMLKSFRADQAVFLSANHDCKGVNIANSCAVSPDRSYLNQYAEYFWRYDPLYQMQFCSDTNKHVFKTDDIIPFSKMVKLEYYNSFLRPQNLLAELIIRINTRDKVSGVISLQRFREHSNFNVNDTQKASLLVPYLSNIFEAADRFIKINEERMLLEQWLDSHSEGLILLDSQFSPLYCNSEAKLFCTLMNGVYKNPSIEGSTEVSIPQVIKRDCKDFMTSADNNGPLKSHSNKIINIDHSKKYYIQYFPVDSPSSKIPVPRFIIFLNKLTRYGNVAEEVLTIEHKLSEREENVAQYAAIGLTNKQIAEKLFISPFTVQNHLKNIFSKTGLNSRTKLASLIQHSNNQLH